MRNGCAASREIAQYNEEPMDCLRQCGKAVSYFVAVTTTLLCGVCHAQTSSSSTLPVSVSVYDRSRIDNWQWFAAPPASETYSHVENLLRVSVAQRLQHWDWQLE